MALTALRIDTQPVGNNMAGQPLLFVQPLVVAVDNTGTGDPTFTGTIVPTLNVISGNPVLGGSEAAGKACVASSCQFTNLTVTGAGIWTITFSCGALAPASTAQWSTFAASKLVVTTPAPNVPAGAGAFYPIVPMRVQAQTPGSLRDWYVGGLLPTIGTLAAGITAGATSIVLNPGDGAALPAGGFFASFYGVVWNATDFASPALDPNAESVFVSARSGDTLTTVVRGQEGTAAVAHNTGGKTYKFARTGQQGSYPNANDPRLTVAVGGGPGVVSGPTSAGFIAGECVFRGIRVSAPGTYTYTISYGINQPITVASGTFTVSAAVDTFVNPDGRFPGLGVALPRTVPNRARHATAGRTIRRVGPAETYTTIQAAYDASGTNDRIIVTDAAGIHTEEVLFGAKTAVAGQEITIESENWTLPVGTRATAMVFFGAGKAKWQNQNINGQAFKFSPGAPPVRLLGLEIRSNPAVIGNSALAILGLDDGVLTGAPTPTGLWIEQCYMHHDDPTSAHTCARAVRWRAKDSGIIDSTFVGFQRTSQPDAQSVLCDNTPGNLLFENNDTEGESEGLMFGGSTFLTEDMVPQDVTIRFNMFRKPKAQIGVWQPKNLLEFKAAHRVRSYGNIYDGFWDSGVSQWSAVNIKSVNQDSDRHQGWIGTSDVYMGPDFYRNLPDLFTFNGTPQGEVEPESHVLVSNSLAVNVNPTDWSIPSTPYGDGFLMHGANYFDLCVDHVTMVSAPKAMLLRPLSLGTWGDPATRTRLTNLLLVTDNAASGASVAQVVSGTNASPFINGIITTIDPAMVVDHLHFAGIVSDFWRDINDGASPASCTFVSVDGSGVSPNPGFANWGLRATAGSAHPLDVCDAFTITSGPCFGTGTGGSNIGVKDMAALKTAITGVLEGTPGVGDPPPDPPPDPTPGVVTQLVFDPAPTGVVSNQPFGCTVKAKDSLGSVVTSFTGRVRLFIAIGRGQLTGPNNSLTQSCVAGVATFTGLKLRNTRGPVEIGAVTEDA
jgi:hypothetical protein